MPSKPFLRKGVLINFLNEPFNLERVPSLLSPSPLITPSFSEVSINLCLSGIPKKRGTRLVLDESPYNQLS